MGEVLEQDVDGVGCAVRALELLSREDWFVGFDERVERVAHHDAEVLQPHLVDALVHWRDEFDERDDLVVEDFERLGECTSSKHMAPLELFSKRYFSARTFSSLAC